MRRVTLLIAVFLLGAAAAVQADVSLTPVKARMERPEQLPIAGREFTTTITIQAAQDATFSDLAIDGKGWTVTRWDGARSFALTAGGKLDIALAALPRDGFGPLVLTAEVNGLKWRQTFALSREAYGGLLPTDSDLLPPQRVFAAGGEKFPAAPQFTLAELTALSADGAPTPNAPDKTDYTCTVRGNLCYWKPSESRWLPAFGAKVWLEVPTPGQTFPYYSIGLQSVDEWGRFSIQAPDNIDFRVAFSASSIAVVVQEDGIWEDNYKWRTATATIADGETLHEVGPIYPNDHHGALHICTVVTYAHNNFRDLGWDVTQIDLQWPDEDGSFYSPGFEELHLEPGDEWADGTICHEWGHYWHDQYAHSVEITYCNGNCDEPGDCGHCVWCPEYDNVVWIEGCANILSRLNTDYLTDRVQFNVAHMDLESWHLNAGCNWIPWNIEGVFAGAVWDMADDDYGTEFMQLQQDALGNDVSDQLDLDTNDILHIMADNCSVEGHEPYRAPGFFRCAAEYLDGLGDPQATRAKLWETVYSWDMDIDEAVPGTVATVTSSFPLNTPTQIAMGGFNWSAATDDMSGVCGYGVSLNPNAPVMPDHLIDTTTTQWWPSNQLDPGTYYFSVIAVDRSGKWSATPRVYGPIIIEAHGPADLDPHIYDGWTAPLVLRSTLAPDSPEPVTQPNYVQGHTVYFNWGERNNGTGPSGLFADCMYLDGDLVYTSSYRSLNMDVGTASRNQGPRDLDAIGRHTVWMRLDGLDAVPESDENDNIYAKQFVFTPEKLSPDETVVRSGGLPDATAGLSLLPSGTPLYPNCDGYDIDLCFYPELVWAVPDDGGDRIVLRLHDRDIGQTGFTTALATGTSLPDRPAVIIQNPQETMMTDYCIGVMDEVGSGNTYRIHREIGSFFALPDTIPGTLSSVNSLDFYWTYNELSAAKWFTLKLANIDTRTLGMYIFDPGFESGSLADADHTIFAADGDTACYTMLLQPGELALTVVTRDPRFPETSDYTIFAYVAKSDLASTTPSGWYANVVPQIGKPYSASLDGVPAPATLVADEDSTGIYWSLCNLNPDVGTSVGLNRRVDLDGVFLSGSIFIDPVSPGQQIKSVDSSLHAVRGGRHTLSHRVNYTRSIDEDDYANNDHGRQWVWNPSLLAANVNHALPLPISSWGGLSYVDEGLVALNCDGYRLANNLYTRLDAILAVYAVGETADIDIGLYSDADVQDGFTTALTRSTWSGNEGDFVLRLLPGIGSYTSYVGAVRSSGASSGSYTLRSQASTASWSTPVGGSRSGTVEADTFLDTVILTLPVGSYVCTLESDDAPLGFSLHDLSDDYGAKSDPWQNAIAWQETGEAGQDVRFTLGIPDPAPTRFGLVIWRPNGSTLAQDAAWTVTISGDVTDAGDGALPDAPASRLVGAAPNPFNPSTTVTFEMARQGRCELAVHDMRGGHVRSLVSTELAAGRHEATWDGLDERGQRTPSGIYLVRLKTEYGEVSLLKLTLVK